MSIRIIFQPFTLSRSTRIRILHFLFEGKSFPQAASQEQQQLFISFACLIAIKKSVDVLHVVLNNLNKWSVDVRLS